MYNKTGWSTPPAANGMGGSYPGMGTGFPGMAPGMGVPGMAPGNGSLPANGMGMLPGSGMMPGVGMAPGAGMMPGAGMVPGAGLVGGFTVAPPAVPSGLPITPTGQVIPVTGQEESYIENILRMNLGKVATIYMTFENNSEWNAKIFKGVLEAAGRDHIIISDPTTGKRYLLLMVNLDYITFDQPLVYNLPFGMGAATGLTRQE